MSNGVKKRLLNFRMTGEEDAILAAYCERLGRTRTDVLREFIRSLAQQSSPPRRRPRVPAKAKRKAAPASLRGQARMFA
jgi:hypothetical protein